MFLPPLVVDVRIHEADRRRFRIWLPIVLLWPLLLIIVAFVLMVTVIVDVALLVFGARYHHYTLLVFGALKLLAEARGTHAHVDSHDSTQVDVVII